MAFNPLTQTFDIIEELRLQPGTSELSRAFVLNSELSGLSITYASWDPDSEEEDNGTTIIKPDGVEVGRWIVKESVTRQELSYNNNGGLSISNGNEVSLTNLRAQGINGNDSMDGSISSNFFPFIFSSSNTGWPVGAGSGIQMERRSTGSNRSGFRIFNREQGADTLYYQRKVAGDLTTWGDVETIPFTSQIYTRTQSEERFFGAWYNESGLLGGPQGVDLDAVAGLRAFRVSSSVPGLPAPLAGTNNAAVINLYQEANISPQLVIAVSGTDMSDNFWYRGRQGGDWYKVASTTYVDNAVEPAQQDLTFNAEATLSISDGNSVSINVVKTQALNAGDTLTGTLGGTAFPFTFSGAQSGWAFNDGSGIQIERRHNDTSRSGFRLFNNVNSANALYYQRKAPGDLTTWSTVEQVAFHSQVYTQSQTNARFMGISFNEAIDLGALQTSDLNEVNGARIFRVGSTVANLPTPLQGVNPSTVINLYGPSGTDCPQILMANSGTDVSDNFWYRGTRTSSWYRSASRQWTIENHYSKTQADPRFFGAAFNESSNIGAFQTVDLGSVVGARIFQVESTVAGLPAAMQNTNGAVVINMYRDSSINPQILISTTGDNYQDHFYYRSKQTDSWNKVLNVTAASAMFTPLATTSAEITGTEIDMSTGGINRYKDITADTTFTIGTSADGNRVDVLIRNTDASPHTVDITSVPFADSETNSVPSGGSAWISLVQIDGDVKATIKTYA